LRSITAAANVVGPSSAQAPARVQGRYITVASTFGVASFIGGGDGDKQNGFEDLHHKVTKMRNLFETLYLCG
jgi:hypothetical protein